MPNQKEVRVGTVNGVLQLANLRAEEFQKLF